MMVSHPPYPGTHEPIHGGHEPAWEEAEKLLRLAAAGDHGWVQGENLLLSRAEPEQQRPRLTEQDGGVFYAAAVDTASPPACLADTW